MLNVSGSERVCSPALGQLDLSRSFYGSVLEVPSDAGVVPNESSPIPESHSHSPFIDSDSDGEKAENSGAATTNPTTPNRAGDEPSAPAGSTTLYGIGGSATGGRQGTIPKKKAGPKEKTR